MTCGLVKVSVRSGVPVVDDSQSVSHGIEGQRSTRELRICLNFAVYLRREWVAVPENQLAQLLQIQTNEGGAHLPTTARRLSTTSKYMSLLLYLSPALRHGIGLAKAPAPAPAPTPEPLPPTPSEPGVATLARSLEKSEGGRTMSRRALVDVVDGWPPESSVSSRSCEPVNNRAE